MGEVAAGLRELGDLEAGKAVVEGGGGVLEGGEVGRDGDLFGVRTHFKSDGEAGLLGRFEAEGGFAEGFEAGGGGFQGVETGREEGKGELAAFVGFSFEGCGGLFAREADDGVGYGGGGGVQDGAVEVGGGALSVGSGEKEEEEGKENPGVLHLKIFAS